MPRLGVGGGIGLAALLAAVNVEAGFNVSGLPLWSAAVRDQQAGIRNARVCFIGDSTTAGEKGRVGTFDDISGSAPYQVASLLGDIDTGSAFAGAIATVFSDSRRVGGTATSNGYALTGVSNTVSYAFTPTGFTDTYRIWYSTFSGNGTFTVNVNGGATLATVNCSAAASLGFVDVTATRGMNTLNIAGTTTAVAYIVGIEARDSTRKRIIFDNLGWRASKVGGWVAGSAWSPINIVAAQNPDLSFINLTVNDWNGATDLATYEANLQTLINTCKETGDVVLMIGAPSGSGTPQATQDSYSAVVLSLAASNNLQVINLTTLMGGGYTAAAAAGYMGDTLHPSRSGYAVAANAMKAATGLPTAPSTPISFVGQATASADNVALPAHQAGDLIVVFAYRSVDATAPALPAGFTSINTGFGNSNGHTFGYRLATSSAETSGIWTAAEGVVAHIYRGVNQTTPVGANNQATNTVSPAVFPALVMAGTNARSWVAAFIGTKNVASTVSNAPAGMTNRSSGVTASAGAMGSSDTNGAVTSWTASSMTLTPAGNRYRIAEVEIIAA